MTQLHIKAVIQFVLTILVLVFTPTALANRFEITGETFLYGSKATHVVKVPSTRQAGFWHIIVMPDVGVGKYVYLRGLGSRQVTVGGAGYVYEGQLYFIKQASGFNSEIELAPWPRQLANNTASLRLRAATDDLLATYILAKIAAEKLGKEHTSAVRSAKTYFYILARTEGSCFNLCTQAATLEIVY